MSWLFSHKLLTLFIVAAMVYWFTNPPDRFGVARKGFVVFKKIPIAFLDCYIDPNNKLHLEGDLADPTNVNYWFEEHFVSFKNESGGTLPLLIGTGFNDTVEIKLDREMLQNCRDHGFEPRFYLSPEAIALYNKLRGEGVRAGILLKVK